MISAMESSLDFKWLVVDTRARVRVSPLAAGLAAACIQSVSDLCMMHA